MRYNVYRNGTHIAYCNKKDFLLWYTIPNNEFDTINIEEAD